MNNQTVSAEYIIYIYIIEENEKTFSPRDLVGFQRVLLTQSTDVFNKRFLISH